MPADECDKLRRLVLAITDEDTRGEQESAQIDTEACTLQLRCTSDVDRPRIYVQRQSLEGKGHVAQAMRALHGIPLNNGKALEPRPSASGSRAFPRSLAAAARGCGVPRPPRIVRMFHVKLPVSNSDATR
jgi:hypothetical protein